MTAINGVVGFKDGANVGLKVGLYDTVGSYEIVGDAVGCGTGLLVGCFVGFWVGGALKHSLCIQYINKQMVILDDLVYNVI